MARREVGLGLINQSETYIYISLDQLNANLVRRFASRWLRHNDLPPLGPRHSDD
jgi:hypothetical protein